MKISLGIAMLILAIAAWIGARDRQQISELRASIANSSGRSTSNKTASDSSHRKRVHRPSQQEATRVLTQDILAYLREVSTASEEEQAGMGKRYSELMERAKLLDASSFEQLITAIRDTSDISPSSREDTILWLMSSYSGKEVQTVLNILSGDFDFPDSPRFKSAAINNTIASLAHQDPYAAKDWLEVHVDDQSGYAAAKSAIVGKVADDPATAFRFLSELNIERPYEEIEEIILQSNTPEKRTTTLGAFRAYLDTVGSDAIRNHLASDAIYRLATSAARAGFENGSRWLDENFTPQEIIVLSKTSFVDSSLSPQWRQWLQTHKSP